jgi:cytochrome c2
MKEAERLCPQCAIPMEEVPVKAEPNAIPTVAAQPLDDVKAGVVVMRLECPKCHHIEGRHPKGQGTWKDAQGKSAG